MKKVLITISPICVVLAILMWISFGLKGVLVSFGAVIFIVVWFKWAEFVDKRIKD